MTHQRSIPTGVVGQRPSEPALAPTSILEVQLEGRLVARCGAGATLRRRLVHDRTTRVDWVLAHLDEWAE